METVKLEIGSETSTRNGSMQYDLRPVEFKGQLIAEIDDYLDPNNDSRGIRERLYKTEDNRLFVHIYRWTRWQGETSTSEIVEVNQDDLGVNGQFERLGREAGYGRPLTLDEAINEQ